MKKLARKILIGILGIILVCFIFGGGMLVGLVFASPTSSPQNGNLDLTTFENVYNLLMTKFYYGEDSEAYSQKLIEDAINGMVDAQGDIHTTYFTAEQLAEFTSSLESSFVGIGVTYSSLEESILVKSVIKGSPAEASGVLAGDEIIGVDGTKLTKENVGNVADMIKGKKGTDVTITVARGNEILDITITRDEISNTVFSEVVGDGIGVLELTSFSDGTGKEVGNHLSYLKENGVTKLIIDLRDNGGGYASTLDEISAYFMNEGDIIMVETDRDGNKIYDKCKAGKKYTYEKIIILVNENSASCSEVFTMAMKENCGAIVVGETTYGKGVAQLTKLFSDGSALKYTDLAWSSGQGVFVGDTGITPDYVVRLPEVLYQTYLVLEEEESYSYDCVNNQVAKAQNMLDFLGYDAGRNDGYFNEKTKLAIQSFQKEMGFEATGILNSETANSLNSAVIKQWSLEKKTYDYQMNKALELMGE